MITLQAKVGSVQSSHFILLLYCLLCLNMLMHLMACKWPYSYRARKGFKWDLIEVVFNTSGHYTQKKDDECSSCSCVFNKETALGFQLSDSIVIHLKHEPWSMCPFWSQEFTAPCTLSHRSHNPRCQMNSMGPAGLKPTPYLRVGCYESF